MTLNIALSSLNGLAAAFNENARAHGFYDEPRTFDRSLMLLAGEIFEAHEDFRDGRPLTEIYYLPNSNQPDKPRGVPTELADVIIRCLDTCHDAQIDIEHAVGLKHAYNLTRPYKHGRNF